MSKKVILSKEAAALKICKRIPPKKNPLSAHFPTRICEVLIFPSSLKWPRALRRGHVSFSPSVAARSCLARTFSPLDRYTKAALPQFGWESPRKCSPNGLSIQLTMYKLVTP
ncbi:hypothetical protein CDAR_282101 [Caerostris darwini]|uniref:Uncharacterized protein n=1 Tax=Caerostris darwini TaxID=1538125 RepID=A0AAV4WTD8_9ARAC|nr:hypothetical protein CDAR_282101 [Caerostris darwini]